MTSGLHSHPEVPDGITPRERPPEPPSGSLAPVPAWAPLAALVGAFVVATVAYLLIAAVVEAGGGNVTVRRPARPRDLGHARAGHRADRGRVPVRRHVGARR